MAGKAQTTSSKSLSLSPLKRKSDLLPAEKCEDNEEKKRQKPINPVLSAEECEEGGTDEEDEEESVISSVDDNEGISDDDDDDDDDVEKFLSDDSLAVMEVGNMLSERMRPRDSLRILSRVREEGNDGDDVSDLDYCVDEGEEVEEKEEEDDISDDDDDVERFLSDDSLAVIEVDNILSERMRPRDSLKLLNVVKKAKNDGDDVDDSDYCVEEEEEDEDDEETETEEEEEEEHQEVDNGDDDDDDDDDDVEKFLSDDSLTLIEVDNILLERTRPCDSLKLVCPVKKAKNDCDDVDDRDYCVDEQEEEDEEDEETDTDIEEEKENGEMMRGER